MTVEELKRTAFKTSALLLSCVLAISPTLTAASQELPALGDGGDGEMSVQTERKLGEQIMHEIRKDRDYLDDAPTLEYMNGFGNLLLTAFPEARSETNYDYFFFVVRDPRLNAFALPGGEIAVHSALLLAAQNESELAGVLAHEVGHVSQRHVARMLGHQRESSIIALAAMALAVLAARGSDSDAPMAVMMGGQGLAMQRQLDYSRDAEREADRVGLQIMREAGFDASGFISFFNRLQTVTRSQSDAVPPFLRSHPMTTERIADIQNRIQDMRYKQRADSIDFHLIRARVRVLQDESVQGLRDAARFFELQAEQKNGMQLAAAKYGLAYVALKQRAYAKARTLLQEAIAAAGADSSTPVFANLSIDISLAADDAAQAVKEADAAREKFPVSRGIARQYADALHEAKRYDDAARYLRDQLQLYPREHELHDRLAKTYSAQGKHALEHMALAESYALRGSPQAAIEQMRVARRMPDASYYDQSVIDAREREWQAIVREQMKEMRKGR